MPDNELKEDGEWRASGGIRHQLCVVEELDLSTDESAHAIITFGGFSLCREHFQKVTGMIREGISMGEIVNLMMTEGL